jgi:Na+/proline symporter
VAQCLPGIVGLLYWQRASKSGFIAGLLVGGSTWGITLLLPLFERAGIIVLPFLSPPNLAISTTDSALWSLVFNSLTFVLFLLIMSQSDEEREVSDACFRKGFLVPQGKIRATSIDEFEHQLSKVIGTDITRSEIKRALSDLGIDHETLDTAALPFLRAPIN